MIYYKVDEEFIYEEKRYIVKLAEHLCNGCAFDADCDNLLSCMYRFREDHNNVIFKEIENNIEMDIQEEKVDLKNSEARMAYCFEIPEYGDLNDNYQRVLRPFYKDGVFVVEVNVPVMQSLYVNAISNIREFFSKRNVLLKEIILIDIYIVTFKQNKTKDVLEVPMEMKDPLEYPIRQLNWVRENSIGIGDNVFIECKLPNYFEGWGDMWSNEMDRLVGCIGKIRHVSQKSISVQFTINGNTLNYSFSYQSLRKMR